MPFSSASDAPGELSSAPPPAFALHAFAILQRDRCIDPGTATRQGRDQEQRQGFCRALCGAPPFCKMTSQVIRSPSAILDSALLDPGVRDRLMSSLGDAVQSDVTHIAQEPKPTLPLISQGRAQKSFATRTSQWAFFASGFAVAALTLLWIYPRGETHLANGPRAPSNPGHYRAVYRGAPEPIDSGRFRFEIQRFHWPDFAPGAKYRLLIYDRSFNKIATLTSQSPIDLGSAERSPSNQDHRPEQRVEVSPELQAKLKNLGSFYWLVEAYHDDGKKSESRTQFEKL